MKIVIAPDKFKGSLTGFEFCNAVEEGLKKVTPNLEILKMPLADGGDGTADVVQYYMNGEKISLWATDPLFRTTKTSYLFDDKKSTAYIEMAEISGLALLAEEERNCMHTTSYGTGQLIIDAIDRGAKKVILGIGGSATNDGGMGLTQALGFRFLDVSGNELKPIGSNLNAVKRIDTTRVHAKLPDLRLKVACDVSNPFYGPNGAAHVYAAQKGATKEEIKWLDDGLRNFSKVLSTQCNLDVQEVAGTGAAGGIGGGAMALLGGELISGISLIKALSNFEDTLTNVDWVITGEGKLDHQTLTGKTIAGVIKSAKQKKIPVAALCGSITITQGEMLKFELDYVASISDGYSSLEEAIADAYPNLVKAAEKFGRFLNQRVRG